MTDIPDDVVERALKKAQEEVHYKDAMRAAGRVFVEWERERIYALIEQYLGQEDLLDYLRASTAPDDCNPSDYT
jgi:hypothetical protein